MNLLPLPDSKRRNHFSHKKLLSLFLPFKVVSISNARIIEKKRAAYGGYFDIVTYFGRKPFQQNMERRGANGQHP